MRLKIIIIAFFAAITLGCSDYLTVVPQGSFEPQTDEDYASLMHEKLFNIEAGYDEYYIIGNYELLALLETISDNLDGNIAKPSPGLIQLPLYVGDVINRFQRAHYQEMYAVIKDCDLVIDNIGGRKTETARQASAAAYAMKGICYYNLMRIFCQPFNGGNGDNLPGMPIGYTYDMDMTKVPERGTLKELYNYVVKMLEASIAYEVDNEKFVFTQELTSIFLAKAHLWAGQYEKAAAVCEEVLSKTEYRLSTIAAYEEMIQAPYEKKGEVIFRDMINDNVEADYFRQIYQKTGLKDRPINYTLYKLFGDEPQKDVRWKVMADSKRLNNKVLFAKVRVSELYLMLAECYAHMGGGSNETKALELINELRRNRIENVADYTTATLPQPDPTALIKVNAKGEPLTPLMRAIFDERRKELYLEGDRWFELKRNGRPEWWVIFRTDGLKYTVQEYLYTAPMHYRDVALSGKRLEQNPGYDELF